MKLSSIHLKETTDIPMSSECQKQGPHPLRMREDSGLPDNRDGDDYDRDEGSTSSSPPESSIRPASSAVVTATSSLPRSTFTADFPSSLSSISSLRKPSTAIAPTVFVTITVTSAAASSGTFRPSLVDQGGSASVIPNTAISPTTTPIRNAQGVSPVAQRVLIALGCISSVAIITTVLLLILRRKKQQDLARNPKTLSSLFGAEIQPSTAYNTSLKELDSWN
ncbi:hypothetical protein OIDMADRAFT_58950 [Oidiodendron maius Zn]|uniref:Uncharacterized protein n=1 Tax=Oidiodendron maius (strain Zn) TaxID=913774 RepID=A0A0C3GI90_OIDMZ|nr:hypothetical protein OIDMADRAFT_58950 [Oidiodendron maius Zn]